MGSFPHVEHNRGYYEICGVAAVLGKVNDLLKVSIRFGINDRGIEKCLLARDGPGSRSV